MLAKLKSLVRRQRIAALRREARKTYVSYLNLLDELDCGNSLADQIHGHRKDRLAYEFNRRLDTLQSLGEPVPPMRLPCARLRYQLQNQPNPHKEF